MKKEIFIGLGLSIISCLVIIFVFELLFPFFLPFFSINLRERFLSPFSILCQCSKKELIPKDYIAILGDSYADGEGDWYITANKNKNPKTNSAHVLNELLKRDVISFGEGGASSPIAVQKFIYKFEVLKKKFKLEDPEIILFYFDETNDLEDNLINRENYKYFNKDVFNDSLAKKINNEIVDSKISFLGARYLIDLSKLAFFEIRRRYETRKESFEFVPPKCEDSLSYNLAEIDNKTYHLPDCDFIQSDKIKLLSDEVKYAISTSVDNGALGLSEHELKTSLEIFKYSLDFLVNRFPDSKIIVTYIPAFFSCYSLKSNIKVDSYTNFSIKHDAIYNPSYVANRSNQITENINQICKDLKAEFLDSRPFIKLAASKQPVHGPLDWGHFNKYGYTKLAECITSYLQSDRLVSHEAQ